MIGHAGAEDEPEEKAMRLTLPREEIKPAWRAAVQAYRAEYRVIRRDRFAPAAAFKALRQVLPEMPEDEAKLEVSHAIAYTAANHGEWFWGVPLVMIPSLHLSDM